MFFTDYPISNICVQIPIQFVDIFAGRKTGKLGRSLVPVVFCECTQRGCRYYPKCPHNPCFLEVNEFVSPWETFLTTWHTANFTSSVMMKYSHTGDFFLPDVSMGSKQQQSKSIEQLSGNMNISSLCERHFNCKCHVFMMTYISNFLLCVLSLGHPPFCLPPYLLQHATTLFHYSPPSPIASQPLTPSLLMPDLLPSLPSNSLLIQSKLLLSSQTFILLYALLQPPLYLSVTPPSSSPSTFYVPLHIVVTVHHCMMECISP